MPKPRVILRDDLSEDTRRTWIAIQRANHPAQLFLFGAEIVWIFGKPATVKPVNAMAVVRRFATDHVHFRKRNGGQSALVRAEPRDKLFQNLLAGPTPDLPRLRGVVRVPVFHSEGLLDFFENGPIDSALRTSQSAN